MTVWLFAFAQVLPMPFSPVVSRRTVVFGAPLAVGFAAGLAGQARAVAPAGAPTYAAQTLPAAAAAADIALMRRALETIHPGLTRRASRRTIARAFANLEAKARMPVDELELYRAISQMLAVIRCDHTKAEQPAAFEAWRQDNPSHLPFRFRLLQGRMIVVSSTAPGELARGAEILAINARPVRDLIETLGQYVAIDGASVWSRAQKLADDSDLMGADFDHFYPYVFGQTAHFDLSVRADDGATPRTIRLPAISFRAWLQLQNDGRGYFSNFSETTRWRMLDADAGYLSVETFVNYRRPTDAQSLFTNAMTQLQAQGATRLIVDLRQNGGGSDDAALALLDHLAARPYIYQRAIRLKAVRYGDLPDHIETWGDRDALFNPPLEAFTRTPDGWYERRAADHLAVLGERTPAAAAFKGPVTLLIGPANASGATMLISKLRDEGRVRLVGERAGGSGDGPTAGRIFNVKLPNSGIKVRIPIAFNAMNVARFDKDGGVRPDILVQETVADFRAGRDAALARAREI
jgi:hypothetical protein